MSTQPQACALMLAIPLTPEELWAGAEPDANKDFARSLLRQWPEVTRQFIWEANYRPVVATAHKVMQATSARGVTVIPNATLAEFGKRLPDFQVVMLVAHWRTHGAEDGDVEFYDQLHTVEEVNAAIPSDYTGIIDFSVCRSTILGAAINRNRRCHINVGKQDVTPTFRLLLFASTIELLANQPMDYAEAAFAVRQELRNQTSQPPLR